MPENNLSEFLGQISAFTNAKIQEIHEKLTIYEQLLIDYNNKINLISQNDLLILWARHFQDSLTPVKLLIDLSETSGNHLKVIDVGSGAGMPGIPLSIAMDRNQFTFVESKGKKCDFIQKAIADISIRRAQVLCERAEDLGQNMSHREKYNVAISRALAKPITCLELVMPLVAVGGYVVLWTVVADDDNNKFDKVITMLGGKLFTEINYKLPGDENTKERKIVLIEKISNTPSQYPRSIGVPKKRPIM